jgi:hypothetical protein
MGRIRRLLRRSLKRLLRAFSVSFVLSCI